MLSLPLEQDGRGHKYSRYSCLQALQQSLGQTFWLGAFSGVTAVCGSHTAYLLLLGDQVSQMLFGSPPQVQRPR